MVNNVKILVICLAACLGLFAIGADAQELGADKPLQPQSLKFSGIYDLKQAEPNLTGSGVKFAIVSRSLTYIDGKPQNDYRPGNTHNCLNAAQLKFKDQGQPTPGISAHSTAICSILFGNDPNACDPQLGKFHYQGITPDAQGQVYEFWHFLINNVFPNSPPQADIITASIGSPFEDWWTRGIESMAEHAGLIVVAGIGNGLDAYDPPLYPAAGSNVIAVGVIDTVNTPDLATNLANFSLAYPHLSSFGPTDKGLCKPDIVAPGNCLAADINEPNSYETTGSWSSFSTPIVAGTLGLLVQKAKQDPNLAGAISPQGGNCVTRAILMNSATKLPYWHKGRLEKTDDHQVPLDYIQGAGLLNATGAYEHLIAGENKPGSVPATGWDLNQLDEEQPLENSYRITIQKQSPKEKIITATIVWNRHYSSEYPFEPQPEKDGNLRLELWAIDPNDPNNDYLMDFSDSNIDNVEHIYYTADSNYTNYQIVVLFSSAGDPNQITPAPRYGLAWNVSDREDKESIFWYDLNADGVVDEMDFIILVNNLITSTKTPGTYLLGDINANGAIDINDFQILMDHRNLKATWYTE